MRRERSLNIMLVAVMALLCDLPQASASDGEASSQTELFLRSRSTLWKAARWASYRKAQEHLEMAQMRLLAARAFGPLRDHPERILLLERSASELRSAHELLPIDPEILHALADTEHELSMRDRSRAPVAVALFERLRAMAPEWEAADVAFALGSLHAQLLDFERAAKEYEICLDRSLEPQLAAQGNLAEMRMLVGDLQGAIAAYKKAIALSERYNAAQSLMLGLWGLAVAEDRIGDPTLALEDARRALALGPLSVLRSPGVFFEPDGELAYYEALGHLAMGLDSERPRSEREQHLETAARAFESYLRKAGRSSPFASTAHKHLREIGALLDGNERGSRRDRNGARKKRPARKANRGKR